MRASDLSKDQTYYLSSISESSLDKALFPLANISKAQVREIARAAGLHNASREESMGLCFVGERRRFNDFLGMSLLMDEHLRNSSCIFGYLEGTTWCLGQDPSSRSTRTSNWVSTTACGHIPLAKARDCQA